MCNKHFEGTAYIRNLKYELLNLPEPPQVKRFIPGPVPTLHPPIIEAAPNCNEDGHRDLEGTPVTADRMSPEQKIRRGTKRCFEEVSVVANDEPFQMGADASSENSLYQASSNTAEETLQSELMMSAMLFSSLDIENALDACVATDIDDVESKYS
ncbi:hypothetical protein Pmani_015617 [Petrolisthes manimaculis]|uniref:Uncharacterized protein n=1 Tax=Petrolisthes manimaculis TaxID=1843537 RepID=A0AAE1U7I7_9EUCA|nr:hypothetical protein Pmani_015617 [Petrolisthes manimaculis]